MRIGLPGRTTADPVTGRRAMGGAFIRFVYGTGVLALVGYLAWSAGRSVLFLEGPGDVMAPKYIASTPYLSQVVHMNVSPGITVQADDVLAFTTSPQVERERTENLRLQLEQADREGELNIRLRVAAATLSATKDRLAATEQALARLDGGTSVSTAFRLDLFRERSEALLLNARAEAEIQEIRSQLERIHVHATTLREQLDRLERSFAKGVIVSPVAGVVGFDIAHDGQVISPGQRIAEVYEVGASYIDWHVPSFRLYSPAQGDIVFIYEGKRIRTGYVWEILRLADAGHAQSGSLLRPPKHRQVARVKTLDEADPPPLHTEVTVRLNYLHFMDGILRHLEGWLR